jgi:hypothetical protein
VKRKIQIAFWSVVGVIAIAAMSLAALFYDRRKVFETERRLKAEELKQKIAKLKAEESERKAASEAQVAVVEAKVEQEVKRDSVDAANDLIAALRSDGPGKGG